MPTLPIEPPAQQLVIAPPAPEFATEVPPLVIEPAVDAGKTAQPEPEDASLDDIAVEPVAEPAVAESRWPLPRVLLDQLQSVIHDSPSADWARQAIDLIHELCRAERRRSRRD